MKFILDVECTDKQEGEIHDRLVALMYDLGIDYYNLSRS